jgi:hypothetical protein
MIHAELTVAAVVRRGERFLVVEASDDFTRCAPLSLARLRHVRS